MEIVPMKPYICTFELNFEDESPLYSLAERAASIGMTPTELLESLIIDLDGSLVGLERKGSQIEADKWIESLPETDADIPLEHSFTAYLANNRLLCDVMHGIKDISDTPITEELDTTDLLEDIYKKSPVFYRGLQAIHDDYSDDQGDGPALSFDGAIQSVTKYIATIDKHTVRT